MDFKAIELNGRNARECGHGIMQNPYFRPENMPRATGESFREWQEKVYHWDIGWYSVQQQPQQQPSLNTA
jgi:hypothetical protein